MTIAMRAASAAMLLLSTACGVRDVDDSADTTRAAAGSTTAAQPAVTQPVEPPMRIEVDIAARQLRVLRSGAPAATYGVAVGTAEWPTQPGSWTISQVVWNPDWIPPDEAWAKDETKKESGARDNPLGHVQLVYDPPRTIHGTNEPASIGKAASHGSIRMRNEDAVALAREVMTAGGAPKDEAWIADARRNRTKKQVVDLPNPVPIVVR